jgi:hypothetical protein
MGTIQHGYGDTENLLKLKMLIWPRYVNIKFIKKTYMLHIYIYS